jgi:hypothetical protein
VKSDFIVIPQHNQITCDARDNTASHIADKVGVTCQRYLDQLPPSALLTAKEVAVIIGKSPGTLEWWRIQTGPSAQMDTRRTRGALSGQRPRAYLAHCAAKEEAERSRPDK